MPVVRFNRKKLKEELHTLENEVLNMELMYDNLFTNSELMKRRDVLLTRMAEIVQQLTEK